MTTLKMLVKKIKKSMTNAKEHIDMMGKDRLKFMKLELMAPDRENFPNVGHQQETTPTDLEVSAKENSDDNDFSTTLL